jgi:pyridoxal phosphate enzyme (YggS family)
VAVTTAWDVAAGLAAVRARIRTACERAGRAPNDVRLLAASKNQSLDAIRSAYAQGQREFGENYVQELVHKAAELRDVADLRFHLIGPLQRNKAKDIARLGCTVQTLDSLRVCEALAVRATEAGCVIDTLLQVNVAGEAHKAGVATAELPRLAAAVRATPALRLLGLMAIPRATATPDETRGYFARLRDLAAELGVSELSMGMSQDLELAIEQGATMVRVGTAIFGPRTSTSAA